MRSIFVPILATSSGFHEQKHGILALAKCYPRIKSPIVKYVDAVGSDASHAS